jgi:L-asparaginase II
VFAKVGAEGVHTVMVPERKLGFAVKVEDGAIRAQHAAVVAALLQLDILPDLPARLAEYISKPIRNTRGEVVGELRVTQRKTE